MRALLTLTLNLKDKFFSCLSPYLAVLKKKPKCCQLELSSVCVTWLVGKKYASNRKGLFTNIQNDQVNTLYYQLASFFVKRQIISIFGFVVSVEATQPCCSNAKTELDHMQTNGCVFP